MIYKCNPNKNTKCNKRVCGKPCTHTHHKEFAKVEGEAAGVAIAGIDLGSGEYMTASAPLLVEAKANVKRKHTARKAGAVEKGIHQDPPVLPVEGMEEETEMDSAT